MWLNKRRKKIIIAVIALFAFFVPLVVYATNFNQPITDTLNLVTPTNFWFQSISNTLNFLSSTNYWYVTNSNNLGFATPPHFLFSGQLDNLGFCVNITATGFNNCGATIAFTLIGGGGIQTITLTGCSVSPASVTGNGNPVPLTTNPLSCQITAHLPSGYFFTGNNQQNEFFNVAPASVLSDTYYTTTTGSGNTITTIITQTVFNVQSLNQCQDLSSCTSNTFGAFLADGFGTLFILLLTMWLLHEAKLPEQIIAVGGALVLWPCAIMFNLPLWFPFFVNLAVFIMIIGVRIQSASK